jgi:uncharacterized membrane protein YkoI
MSTNLLSKKVILVAILAVGAVSAILVASSIAQATAQQEQQKMMMWAGDGMPKINGSVSVGNEVSDFVKENAKVSFVTAAETAQKQANGTVLGGHIGVVQGYLVYTFFAMDAGNQTGHMIIVDAGNGSVLYTSEGQPIGSFGQQMFGPWGAHGYGGPWHGQWNSGGWGMWHH